MTETGQAGDRQPDSGYAGADFDRYFADADRSQQLGDMFHEHFDASAPAEVQGFCFVTMPGFRRIAELLAPSPDGPLLDAACGRGGPGIWLAQHIGHPLHGIDISRVAIELARATASGLDITATFAEGTLADTGCDDAAFAATVCLDALHFADQLDAAVNELRRVTRPGGMLVATTWLTTDGPPRLRQDLAAALTSGGWSLTLVEDHPDWLEAQLRLYAATLTQDNWDDPALRRVREEGEAISPALTGARRLLIQARRV